jgi:aspartyl-tRNA(Asn)/glutamyl-tRNA(Gln) amidotransferase subunit C
MKVSLEDVDRIANLARLGLSDSEREHLRRDLDTILTYIEKLGTVDTARVEATAHLTEMPTPLRDDVATNPHSPELMVANAPKADRTFLCVPKILD